MTSGRLRIMLQDKEKARIKRVTEPYSFKHFPMPPTQYAVMMKRLNTPGAKPRSQIINFFCSSHPCTCVRRGAPRIGTQHEVATRRLAARPRAERQRLRHDTDVGPSVAKRPPDALAAEWRLSKRGAFFILRECMWVWVMVAPRADERSAAARAQAGAHEPARDLTDSAIACLLCHRCILGDCDGALCPLLTVLI